MWPVEERPPELPVEASVNNLPPAVMLDVWKGWELRQSREEKSMELFRKDTALPTKQYDGGPELRRLAACAQVGGKSL
jgi:hypothetical protein